MLQYEWVNKADRYNKLNRVLILVPATATHLGLFSDVLNREDTDVVEVGFKRIPRWLQNVRRINLSKKINNVISLPFKDVWFNRIELTNKGYRCIVVIDGALNYLSEQWFDEVRRIYPEIKIFLYLINSLDASSPTIKYIKKNIDLIRWDKIFTFDPIDALKHNFIYKGFCYYSVQKSILQKSDFEFFSDAFFIGGMKGNRDTLILKVYEYLSKKSVNCDFRLMVYGNNVPSSKNGIKYFNNGWRPYSEILDAVAHTKCIIEIMQEGQSGASLRYFEAVCYNKKLLSNNDRIVDFPYYDSRYMKIFKDAEDVDIEWLLDDVAVEYNYKGDFSPNGFIDMLKEEYLSDSVSM